MTDKFDKKPGLGEGDEMMGPRPAIVMPSHGIYRSSKSILSNIVDCGLYRRVGPTNDRWTTA